MFLDVNGTRLHYLSEGEGPTIVLLHGLGGTSGVWRGVMNTLTTNHHVVAVDLRGHGRSAPILKPVTIRDFADDVLALLDALDLPAVTLVGHSFASLIAQMAAAVRPSSIDNLVLVGGMSWLDPDARDAYIDRAELVEQEGLDAIADAWITSALAPRTHAHSPQLSGLTREMLERNDPASYAAACRAISKYQPIAHEDLGQPTLLLVGDHDRSTPVAMSEELHAAIPVTRIEVIPSAAHWAMLDQPDWISAKIMTWLL